MASDMIMQTQDLSQSLIISDSQFAASYVEHSQPLLGQNMPIYLEVFEVSPGASIFVPVVLVEPTATSAAAALKAKKDGRGNNMKWQPFISMFVLNKKCELISSWVRTDKGFKEVHLNTVAKQVFDFCGQEVDVHPDLYNTVMEKGGFSDEALMAALSHLLDNRAQGVGFVSMADAQRVLWLRSWLGKHYH